MQVRICIKKLNKMKHITIFIFIFAFTMNAHGQFSRIDNPPTDLYKNIDQMGIDEDYILKKNESDFFNSIFDIKVIGFNFEGKKIAFITRNVLRSKKDYFSDEKERLTFENSPTHCYLYIFNQEQKMRANYFDAVIVYWNKRALSKEDMVKIIQRDKK